MENNQDIAALESMAIANNYNTYLNKLITSNLDKKNNILDFGAGYGVHTEKIKNAGYKIMALEINKNCLKILKDKNINSFSTFDKVPRPINCIISLNVLEHIENDDKIIKECYNNLDVGGKLILYLPASNLIWTELDELVNHKRRYTKSKIEELLNSNQFLIEKIFYVDFIGWLVLLLSKILKIRLSFDIKKIKFNDRFIFKTFKFIDFFTKNIIGKNLFIVAIKQ